MSALNAFTAVTGWQVGLPAELAQGVASPGVRGSLPPEKALDRLLVGTNLSYRKLGNNNIVLEKRSTGGALNLEQVTISATRQEQERQSVPSTVTVHTREELDRNNVNIHQGSGALRAGCFGRRCRSARRHQRLQHPWHRR